MRKRGERVGEEKEWGSERKGEEREDREVGVTSAVTPTYQVSDDDIYTVFPCHWQSTLLQNFMLALSYNY